MYPISLAFLYNFSRFISIILYNKNLLINVNNQDLKQLALETERLLSDALHQRLTNEFVDKKLRIFLKEYNLKKSLEVKITPNNEILINSGHNPDYCASLGWGWWEDSPNMVKYAINKDKKFMTFTSLEPIFVHYMKNYDGDQPGEKDNKFLYEQYPHLKTRRKMTGWETALKELNEVEHLIRVACNYDHLTFITWEEITRKRKKKIEHELDEFFAKGRKKLNETWISYKLLTGVEIGKY